MNAAELTAGVLADLKQMLADAKRHRAHYEGLAREVRDMAAERETPQGRDATMNHAMRLAGQALTWQNRVIELTAQIAEQESQLKSAPAQVAPVVTAEMCAAQDDTMNFRAEVLA